MIDRAEAILFCDVCADSWAVPVTDMAREAPLATQADDAVGVGLDHEVGVNLANGGHLCPSCGKHWNVWMETKNGGDFDVEGPAFDQWKEERIMDLQQ